jgi:hypothetical protein
MEEITSSVVLPVTDAQMTAFSVWILNTYVTYEVVMGAIKSPAIDTYIKTHILPQEMKEILRRSQPYIGEKCGDIYVHRLLIDRRRVIAKMTNLKGKIVSMTFPIEAAQTRIFLRNEATSRRLIREATQLRYQQERQAYIDRMHETYESRSREIDARREAREKVLLFPEIKLPTIVTLSEKDALMDDVCVICLNQHKMTDACTINCGHQFGSACLAKWKKDTCPLCRTKVTETTVFASPIALLLTDADVVALWEVVVA